MGSALILAISPFSATLKMPSYENDRRKRQAFWMLEGKVMGGNAWGGGGGGGGWVGEGNFHEGAGGPWGMELEIIGL